MDGTAFCGAPCRSTAAASGTDRNDADTSCTCGRVRTGAIGFVVDDSLLADDRGTGVARRIACDAAIDFAAAAVIAEASGAGAISVAIITCRCTGTLRTTCSRAISTNTPTCSTHTAATTDATRIPR
ncbi:hypothetical protein [Burkholderia pyrrocinia]|uniref:hypothetical protein n=1 Tax=Burkholderia pyrrocinia TaxID=60550 RepID=UPI002AB24DC4|nr:hypothetical protein [Burkholderia pyrrocinia]